MRKYKIIRNDKVTYSECFQENGKIIYINDFIDDVNFAVITHHTVIIKGSAYIVNLIELFHSISDTEPMMSTIELDTIEKYIIYAEQIG